jgi:hypothetical protein
MHQKWRTSAAHSRNEIGGDLARNRIVEPVLYLENHHHPRRYGSWPEEFLVCPVIVTFNKLQKDPIQKAHMFHIPLVGF